MTLNILSFNCKGLNHPAKHNTLWKEALAHHSDILCVQETHFKSSNPPKCSHKKFPHIFTANGDNKTKGVLTPVRDLVAFRLHEVVRDPHGRFLILICDLNSTTYTIVNVYSPNKHQIHFFNKLVKSVRSLQKGLLLLCGDYPWSILGLYVPLQSQNSVTPSLTSQTRLPWCMMSEIRTLPFSHLHIASIPEFTCF